MNNPRYQSILRDTKAKPNLEAKARLERSKEQEQAFNNRKNFYGGTVEFMPTFAERFVKQAVNTFKPGKLNILTK